MEKKYIQIWLTWWSYCLRTKVKDCNQPIDNINDYIKDQDICYKADKYSKWYHSNLSQYYPPDSKFRSFEEAVAFEELWFSLFKDLLEYFWDEYTISFESYLKKWDYYSIEEYENKIWKFSETFLNWTTVKWTIKWFKLYPL